METKIENKTIKAFREISRQTKKIQETVETVVPDTNDDIGKIVSINTELFLKSKDISGGRVIVGGEAEISVLYITESEKSVSFVRTSKSFTLEYEVNEVDDNAVAQIALSLTNSETRVLNPRKLSVTVEISGEMNCYMQENAITESVLPGSEITIHTKKESESAVLINAACEKTFAFNEQFTFPAVKPIPQKIVWQKPCFEISETQIIGTKALIKGSYRVTLCYLPVDTAYPVQWSFSAPFSQLLDIGQEKMDLSSARIEISSAYFDLVDTISGEKALDNEIHAVLQFVSFFGQEVSYISDAYCNSMPLTCKMQPERICSVSDTQRVLLSSEEQISIADDCRDVLNVQASLVNASISRNRAEASISIDILYQTESGTISAVHRNLMLEEECAATEIRIVSSKLGEVNLRPDGTTISGRINVEISYQSFTSREISMVNSMDLDDEKPLDLADFPSLTLVRVENETVWELAKRYHSCPEKIKAINCLEGGVQGCLLMIPKSV